MCGIAGYVTSAPNGYATSVLDRMTRVIAHRGPDDTGTYRDPHAELGHRRLSIIDLSAGHQPMTSESGDLWVVYNGEIFNHTEVRARLEPRGHVYRTHSDTETILHAYEEYGEQSPTHFRGMFAYVIWDRKRQTLFCVRDRLGIKPFYYFFNGREFIFGSEIKTLLEHPSVSAELESSVLPEHLAFGYTSDDRTLFRGIRKLMPGHTLTLSFSSAAPEDRLRIQRYWDVPPVGAAETHSEAEWLAECSRRLEETVRMRLMSDVPLGMFLSGGVDSSLIAALMKRMVSGPVKTFAVGYKETAYSELGWASQVAQTIGTDHHSVELGLEDFFNHLPRLMWHEDEPIAWPSSVSLYFVSKLASEQVKVVLTGEGSDELFAGYGRYHFYLWNRRYLKAWRMLPGGLRRLIRSQVADSPLVPANLRRKLSHTFVGLGDDLESLYLDNFFAAVPMTERARLGQGGPSAYRSFLDHWAAASGRSDLDRMLYADQKTYLVELLMKQDQMSMAASIESRVPFLDHTFVEFASRVPANLKLHNGTGKYLIKRVAEQFIPREVIYRKKMGFPTPLKDWLRDPRLRPVLNRMLAPDGFLASVTERSEVSALLDRHWSGTLDATDRLWRLLNLHVWGEMYISGRRHHEAGLLDRCEVA